MTEEKKVWVFFYGAYMNLNVLKEMGIVPESIDTAKLSGFDIIIQPRANLIPSFEHSVYGILTTASHSELERLYTEQRAFLPEAIVAQTLDGTLQPALCYIASTMKATSAEHDYVDYIIEAARAYGFPQGYIKHLDSFRPST